ncbi:hypothetical protein HQ584_07115 [Patescibacteria group bacterium]|nr:hypothetical protein [Patescibacteria group bacterium]
MSSIEKTKETVIEFLKKTLNAKDIKIIGVSKVQDGWEAEAEIYEESSFIKALGLPTRVKDRNIYTIKLNTSLEVESYGLKGQTEPVE